ncbi:MAG TPA: winged helix-turn-helix domain-containing protein [Actinotalea sp.]|jgi:hypothetical protein
MTAPSLHVLPSSTGLAPADRATTATGFVLYVQLDPDDVGVPVDDLRRTADTLRELAREWLPSARTRAVLSAATPPQPSAPAGRPVAAALRARLAAVPDTPQVEVRAQARQVAVDGNDVELTRKEFDLLAYLVAARGRAVSRAELQRTVWSDRVVTDGSRTVDVHIRRLRTVPALSGLIATVHGVGYRIASRPNVRLVP